MRVSDPCYDRTTWCSGTVPNCLTGRWGAAVAYSDEGPMGRRVSLLAAKHHRSVRSFGICNGVWADENDVCCTGEWEFCRFEVGVDSGQAGLFDEAHYQNEHVFDGHPAPNSNYGGIWYNYCYDQTLGKRPAGTIPYGAISCSGFGDGGYTALIHKDANGQTDCVIIVYLEEEAQKRAISRSRLSQTLTVLFQKLKMKFQHLLHH